VAEYPPDPGNVFDTDAHRRVMAHLPNPDDDPVPVDVLIAERINRDPHTLAHFDAADEVVDVLEDLEADGHAKQLKHGWKNTPDGFDLLTGPPGFDSSDQNSSATIGLDPASLTNGEG
jgi:hypothetical protein